MRFLTAIVATLCLVSASAALGPRGKLEPGHDAPGLSIEEWVKGQETAIESGRVYVIEFWATWCGPCKKAIPHLTELQDRYASRDLTIIGISDEKPEIVRDFVTSQGKKMDYTVAVDRRDGTTRAWRKAAGIDGIPASFIVDRRGKIQYIGNPHDPAFDDVLAKVIGGRYDAKLNEEVRPMVAASKNARQVRNWRMTFQLLDDIIKTDETVFALYNLDKFEIMLVDMNDADEAYAFADTLIDKYAGDPDFLAALAEKIVVDPVIPAARRRLDVAQKAADAAASATGGKDPDGLAAQALVHYHAGRLEQAIDLQKKAYFIARPSDKPTYKRVLRSYQAAADRAG